MPILDVDTRLAKLRALRDRCQDEINRLEQQRADRARGIRPTPPPQRPKPPRLTPSDRDVRAWAKTQQIPVPDTGRISTTLREQYTAQHTNQKASTTP